MTNYVDLDGAARIARIAADFRWTWKLADVPRLCQLAGWRIISQDGKLWVLETDLRVSRKEAYVRLDVGDVSAIASKGQDIESMFAWVAETMPGNSTAEQDVQYCYSLVLDKISEDLGRPTPRRNEDDPGALWNFSSVAICLSVIPDTVIIKFMNPDYQEWLDRE